ncbi:hypothetical protein CRUP_037256 [Coryphaenoides rupestris]|nr:hypothetical protein CRUP_037256 [Coryphaenoides rupestris]
MSPGDDEDLRVDCRIKPKLSQINSYQFSWSSGSRETLINTNVSGMTTEPRFRESSYVEVLEPYGYRLTLTGFTHTLPYNTTFMCKISQLVSSAYVERDQLLPCSAPSVFSPQRAWVWSTGMVTLVFSRALG